MGERNFVKVVREDPGRKGLLYAGTENGTYVSFDNGEHWNSLQLNLPTVSVRDMVVHGNDLVVGTYGRAFWILDDLTPLRQINEKVEQSNAHLFEPATAIRLRNDMNRTRRCRRRCPRATIRRPARCCTTTSKSARGRCHARDLRFGGSSWCASSPAAAIAASTELPPTCRTTGCSGRRRCPRRLA